MAKRHSRSKIESFSTHLEDAAPTYSRDDLLASRFRLAKVLPYQGASPPFISNLALALFSGFLLVFAFPDWGLWSLGWVGTAPLIMAIVRERRFWRSLLLGLSTGVVFYAGSSYWVTYSMHQYGGISLWLCYLFMLILGVAMGSFLGLFAGALGLAIKRLGGWAILTAPPLWAASEYARILATGVGWNALGYSQAFQPAVIQVSRWGGVYLVSAIMVLASCALVFAVVYVEQRRGLIVLTLAGVIAVASVLYGEWLRPGRESPHSLTAVVIQPNIPVDGAWDEARFFDEMLQRHITLSEEAIHSGESQPASNGEKPKVELVIWPESSINFFYDRDPDLKHRLAEFTTRNGVYLLMSSWGRVDGGEGPNEPLYNSAIVVSPAGEKLGEHDKVALTPFGEYVPARGWLPFAKNIQALVGDVAPGSRIATLDAAGARLGVLICFEATRPELAREMRKEGASSLVQVSNEAWFGPTACARQMLCQAVFRAVENDVELIRVTNSGRSARIDSFGRVSGEIPMFERASRVWNLQSSADVASRGQTFYTRHGDVFANASCVLSGIVLVLALASALPRRRGAIRRETKGVQ